MQAGVLPGVLGVGVESRRTVVGQDCDGGGLVSWLVGSVSDLICGWELTRGSGYQHGLQ